MVVDACKLDSAVGKLNVLDYLINDLGQDPLAKDKDDMTTVHAATQNEMTSTVKVSRMTLDLSYS